MRSPFVIYFAGVGTVVAALATGFGGGIALTKTSVMKETAAMSAMRREKLRTASVDVKAGNGAGVTNAEDRRTPAKNQMASSLEAASVPRSLLNITTRMPVLPAVAAQPVTAREAEPAAEARHASSATERKETAARKPENGKHRRIAERRQREAVVGRQAEDRVEDRLYGSGGERQRAETRVVTRRVVDSGGAPDPDRVSDLDADSGTEPATRTYETHSRGFAGLFDDDDDD